MTGLDKIIDEIKQEAKKASDEALARTQSEVNEILANAKKERDERFAELQQETNQEVELLQNRGEAAANLLKKKMLLEAKQQIIQEMMEGAKQSILNLPDKEYFDTLLHMVKRYALLKESMILLSKRDLDRVPDAFVSALKEQNIVISTDTRNIDGGFILVYGEVEENCSLEALFAASKESLQDQITTIIFKKD